MDADTQNILIIFLALCGPFIPIFVIAAILSPRFKAVAQKNNWTVEPHPADHRDYVFKGRHGPIQWEMEYYMYDHYRKFQANLIPYVQVIVWTTNSATLPQNTILIHPRRDKLKHLVHPRLTLENASPVSGNLDALFDLPEQAIGPRALQELFILRTDLAALPQTLIDSLPGELSSWSNVGHVGPVILINKDGVNIWWVPLGMRNEWLENTVRLGTTLAGGL
jgi:hypothetical protein